MPDGVPGITCVGLGPGDPELLTVRADRLVRGARHIAFFRKAGRPGKARDIVSGLLCADVQEYPMEYPVTTELPASSAAYAQQMEQFYAHWCQRLAALARTRHIVVLCEGEPFLYGSFIHLYTRLRARGDTPLAVVPGVPGMVGCWHATHQPMTQGNDVLSILPGTLPEDALVQHMRSAQALVIMKVGRNLPRIRRALARAGRLEMAWLVQDGTTPAQRVVRLSELTSAHDDAACPYFTTVLVHGAAALAGAVQAG